MDNYHLLEFLFRVLTCGAWIGAGLFKAFHFSGFTEKMRCLGFPFAALSAGIVVFIELIGSLMVVLDVFISYVAIVWIIFTIWATWLDHRHFLDKEKTIIFPEYVQVIKNISIIGGLIALILLDQSRPAWLVMVHDSVVSLIII